MKSFPPFTVDIFTYSLHVMLLRMMKHIFLLGLVYCMDYLEKNIDWLQAKLKPLLDGE